MRFLARALTGSIMAAVTLALLAGGAYRLYDAATKPEKPGRGGQRERSYAVDVGTLDRTTHAPVITAYGQVQAWTSLEIRAPAAGPITEISDNVRDGLTVAKGELLFRIDPEIAGRRVTDAKAALAQAETELSEARSSRTHAAAEIASAKMQVGVRKRDLERKQSLFDKKLTTAAVLDEVRLAVSAAEQALVAREQAQLALDGRIEKAEAGVNRARLSLSDSERALADTAYRAPFAGRLADVTLTLGRRVAQNEKLAMLIDPSALEVSFPVRNADFGHIADPADAGRLLPLAVTATLDLADKDVAVSGRLDRPAAVAPAQTGRTVYARLSGANANALRPGDFVTVEITEPKLEEVAVVPADAATVDGRILLVGTDGRLVEHAARIERRERDRLVVADVPFGAKFVKRRLPYLAAGIKVNPRDATTPAPAEQSPVGSAPEAKPSPAADADGVAIDDARRTALIAFVKSNDGLPDDRRQRMLAELSKPKPSARLIERLEKRIARAETR